MHHVFRSDGTFDYLPSLKKLVVQHVQRQQYRCFNIEWAWSVIFEFSNFDDGIVEQVGTAMPSAKQKHSNVKHGGAIRPNVWVLTFGPPCTLIIIILDNYTHNYILYFKFITFSNDTIPVNLPFAFIQPAHLLLLLLLLLLLN